MTRRSSVAFRRTVLGVILGIPLVAPPLMAQEATPGIQVAEVEEVVGENTAIENTLAEQPRVLISEVLIEGIEGHPEEGTSSDLHLRRHAGASGDACDP